jgi:cysteine synthase A
VLRDKRPGTKIVVCEPDNSQILGSGISQARTPEGAPSSSHPNFRPHLMQGWSPDFIPRLTEDAVEHKYIDTILPINGAEALRLSRELARKEGIFVGISAGATLAGALQICATAAPGSTVLCMLPDTGERYLTTPLFEDIAIDMTAEELDISRSTPGYRFDVTAPAAPAPTQAAAAVEDASADAQKFVADVLGDTHQPVVLFALEWCEFCWSVRKMFKQFGIEYRAIDLDSVEYQAGDRGGQIRRVLSGRFGVKTIPQIFVGGDHIGGATEVFDAWRDGRLQALLDEQGIAYDANVDTDPYSLLPGWLHKR